MAATGSTSQNSITFFLNGKKRRIGAINPDVSVLEYLRTEEGATGTKKSCNLGGCGACTVLLTYFDPKADSFVNQPANACLLPLLAIDGCNVTTIEGLGSSGTGLHPLQQRLSVNNGSQCGFCTPGMIMSMYAVLQENDGKPNLEQISKALQGNLCRCTGYRPIIEAFNTFASDCANCKSVDIEDIGKGKKYMEYDTAVHDPKPPVELKKFAYSPLHLKHGNKEWYRVLELNKALELIKQCKDKGLKYKLLVGNTMHGVYPEHYDVRIDVRQVPELNGITLEKDGIVIGAAVTLQQLIKALEKNSDKSPNSFLNIAEHLALIAGRQVRGLGSWVGGVIMCKERDFASDTATVLFAAKARLSVVVLDGQKIDMDIEQFLAMPSTEVVVTSMKIPYCNKNEHFVSYRSAMRAVNAHALVNAGFAFELSGTTISSVDIVYGAIGGHPKRAKATEKLLVGKQISSQVLEDALASVAQEIKPKPDPTYVVITRPQGKEAYRANLVTSFFYKFYLYAAEKSGTLSPSLTSASKGIQREINSSFQKYPTYEDRFATPKITADYLATGEATFTDDIESSKRTLYAALVTSKRVVCNITRINVAEALKQPGVIDFISADDIPGANDLGTVKGQEQLFAKDKAIYYGQPLGVIVAKTQRLADDAARLVTVEYGDEYTKPILSIQDAIAAKSFGGDPNIVKSGDVESAWADCDHIIEDTVYASGQKHMYMERQSVYCVPEEGERMTVHLGTQALDYTRQKIAGFLGVSGQNVNIVSRRTGGAFGGKLTRHLYFAGACAVAASKLRRPVKIVPELSTDTKTTGGRTAFLANFKLGFKNDGTIVAVKLDCYGNSGMSADFWGALAIEFNEELDSVYCFPNFHSSVRECRTHIPSRTAVRSFGHSQAIGVTETMIESIAAKLSLPVQVVRERNMYTSRNKINPAGQYLGDDFDIRGLYNKLKTDCEFDKRSSEIEAFNGANKWKKRGISLMGIKYGCCQSYSLGTTALVNINNGDGTVVVHTGGCEIGQGLNTKVAQTVAITLGCDIELVKVGDSSTDVSPNSMFVGGSTASEANAEAARLACIKLNKSLRYAREKLMEEKPEAKPTWLQVVQRAHAAHALLSETGNFVPVGKQNNEVGLPWYPFHADYFATGTACSEVEVDILTGEVVIRRVDMLYDSAKSLNAIIDIGQAEGAFVYGIGYFLREEVLIAPNGKLNSANTWEYKLPCVMDSPIDFRIELYNGTKFPRGVMGSKASGEPPMVLSYSAVSAVKSAINASRHERGKEPKWLLPHPVTVDVVQCAADVKPNELGLESKK